VRLLLVEDERKVASFIARSLRENSYTVDIAESGEKALDLVTRTNYDLVLLDVRLPRLSGVEVCREIRDAGLEMPAFMLTVRSLVEQRVEGLDAGADDYLTKPFALAELHAEYARSRGAVSTKAGPSSTRRILSWTGREGRSNAERIRFSSRLRNLLFWNS